MNAPRPPHASDPLLQRYEEANALDDARPDPALRERVLALAREQAVLNARASALPPPREAANDHRWTLRALGSLAVLGLVGLLVLQFDRSPPDERDTALGGASRSARMAPQAGTSPEAASPSGTPAAPALEPGPSPTPPARPVQASPARPAAALPPSAERAERTEAPADATSPQSPRAAAPAASAARAPMPVAPLAAPKAAPMGRAVSADQAPAAQAMPAPETAAAPSLAGGDPPDARGRTPLMLAAARGDAALVERLLAAGADPTQRDAQGWTAAEYARRAGHEALARRLAPASSPASER